jgi:DNA-binding NarL/FixJ family response regulator
MTTSTATELLGMVAAGHESIDLVIIGQIADMNPAVAVREVARACPGVGIIVLTSTRSPGAVMDLCAEGAHAVLAREAADADLAAAIESVDRGHRYVAPDLLDEMFATKRPEPVRPRFDLTVREREVLTELAAGRTNSEISKRLLIGTETVKSHLNNIYDKLDVRRRTHAVSLAVSAGLV